MEVRKPHSLSPSTKRRIVRGCLRLVLVLGIGLAASVCLSTPVHAQQMPGRGNMMNPYLPPVLRPHSRLEAEFQAHRIIAMNNERQKHLVRDTNRLLKLTAELNAEVAKSNSKSLTPDQLHMLARIEKLAKSVKEKMSYPVQGSRFKNLFPPLYTAANLP